LQTLRHVSEQAENEVCHVVQFFQKCFTALRKSVGVLKLVLNAWLRNEKPRLAMEFKQHTNVNNSTSHCAVPAASYLTTSTGM
jgi:hypothetical protein